MNNFSILPNIICHLGVYGDDPRPTWRWLRNNDPVRWQAPGEIPGFWALTKYADVRMVYREPENFNSVPEIWPRLMEKTASAPVTRMLPCAGQLCQRRALIGKWLTLGPIQALKQEMHLIVDQVVERAIEHETCDFATEVAARISLFTMCDILGVDPGDWEYIFTLTNEAARAPNPSVRRMAHLNILDYFEDLSAARKRDPADDFISVLATAEIEGRKLTVNEILLNCINVMVDGAENTRIAATGGALAFLEYNDEWRLLRDEPGLLPSAVEEVLRWTSAMTFGLRIARRPTTIHDRSIAAGDTIMLLNGSANRDESVFHDPDKFDVRRSPNPHLALGEGEHSCPGGTLARMELRLLYEALLNKTERIEMDGTPALVSPVVANGLDTLPVRVIPKRRRA